MYCSQKILGACKQDLTELWVDYFLFLQVFPQACDYS
jgi:hypothetical protein